VTSRYHIVATNEGFITSISVTKDEAAAKRLVDALNRDRPKDDLNEYSYYDSEKERD